MTTMELIYDYVKAHPDVVAATVKEKLDVAANSVSSLLSQLEARGIIESTKKMVVQRSGHKRLIRFYRAAIPEYRLLPLPQKPKSAPPPAEVEVCAPPAMQQRQEARPLLQEATQAQLLDQLLKLQRITMKREIELAIMERISAAFAEPGSEPDKTEPVKPYVFVRGLRRYLIVGLLPAQALVASAKLGDECELRYWKDESMDRLRQHAAWADRVVVMTKFISHSTQGVVKHTGRPLLNCNGGVTDLVAQITHDVHNTESSS